MNVDEAKQVLREAGYDITRLEPKEGDCVKVTLSSQTMPNHSFTIDLPGVVTSLDLHAISGQVLVRLDDLRAELWVQRKDVSFI